MKHAASPNVSPRPKWWRGLFAATSLMALALSPAKARAQADISPAPPNVLLLVDTSGSMDYKTNSNAFPVCRYNGTTNTGQASERSRWIELVEVLTGSINNYDCQKLDRVSAGFQSEYALNGGPPYDYLYANPYNRAASNGCVAGPGTLDAINKALFPPTAIKFHPFDNTAGSCVFNQTNDGVLDAFASDVRFGLMTFDTDPKPAKDMSGLWSYFLNAPRQGEPLGCTTPQDQEVGVRNTDAPPWEGRAVGFGNPALGSTDFKTRNDMIQKVLLATRPYGATPIAAMLDDARTYFVSDNSDDPLDSSFKFGPQNDPAAQCRGKSIILLSDGQPNMDLRPYCEPAGCPYSKPEDIAQDLKSRGIEIYVIGFALGKPLVNGVPKDCSAINPNDTSPTADCKLYASDPAMQACCSLNRIAQAGGHVPTSGDDSDWTHAHFADDRATLRKALSDAIGGNLQTTTRTPWVNASGPGFFNQSTDPDFARAYRLSAPFKPGKLDKPWIGELNRARYVCTSEGGGPLKAKLLDKLEPEKGDAFVGNVNKAGPGNRKIFTVLGNGGVAPVKSDVSMRPNLPVGVIDGVGNYSGTLNTTAYNSSGFVAAVAPEAIKVDDTSCDSSTENLDAAACRNRILNWLVGIDNGTKFSRCAVGEGCNLVGDIYHSIPRAVPGRPAQFLNDATYQKFIQDQANRPSMIYASSNDGFLHAFKLGPLSKDDLTIPVTSDTPSNELWTFVPPGVLPGLPTYYPGTHQLLLDGTPAIKEVVATKDETQPVYKYKLMRTLAQAQNATNLWRTILVQSYGSQRPGYFALDITDPMLDAGGPKFLWQLTTDSAGNQLFGIGGATPLITTVYLDGAEVAVAVLPGGYGSPGTDNANGNNKGCARGKDYSTGWPDGVPPPRSNVKCYSGTAVMARSLTVVRLDTGEILRTFRQKATEVPGLISTIVKESPIDSPMTGTPVAFPPDVAGVADRVFIGDQDGALWRLNLASEKGKIDDWSLDLFFDGFPKDTFSQDQAWRRGQPIIGAPVMSVNDLGQITLAFSTGDQEAIGAEPGMKNFVWSLTEEPSSDRKQLYPKVNWSLDLTPENNWSGDRVVGDIVLFNSNLYFTTVGPDNTGDACSSGSGKVWGMDYVNPKKTAGTGGVLAGPFQRRADVTTEGYIPATTLLGGNPHAYLSGVALAQEPSCEAPGLINDPGYSGYGTTSAAATSPGKFQLIIPTGSVTSTAKGSDTSVIKSGGANAVAIDLPSPSVALVVDSWAAIVE